MYNVDDMKFAKYFSHADLADWKGDGDNYVIVKDQDTGLYKVDSYVSNTFEDKFNSMFDVDKQYHSVGQVIQCLYDFYVKVMESDNFAFIDVQVSKNKFEFTVIYWDWNEDNVDKYYNPFKYL